jgi:hypothetical protein
MLDEYELHFVSEHKKINPNIKVYKHKDLVAITCENGHMMVAPNRLKELPLPFSLVCAEKGCSMCKFLKVAEEMQET